MQNSLSFGAMNGQERPLRSQPRRIRSGSGLCGWLSIFNGTFSYQDTSVIKQSISFSTDTRPNGGKFPSRNAKKYCKKFQKGMTCKICRFFFVYGYISNKIFSKIWSVVSTRSCSQTDRQQTNARLIDWLIQSHQTQYRSYRGRVFTGQMTQPTVSKHWRNTQN